MRFGFLAAANSPIIPHYVHASVQAGLRDLVIVEDGAIWTDVDLLRWNERTGGTLDSLAAGYGPHYGAGEPLPVLRVDNHNDPAAEAAMREAGIDCLVNAGTKRKVSSRIISMAKHGVVNVHPGRLPQYRGCTVVEWAIHNDDAVCNTAHFMDEGYDTGPIIDIECYTFPRGSSYQELRSAVYQSAALLLAKCLSRIAATGLTPSEAQIQDESVAKYWKPIPDELQQAMVLKLTNNSYKHIS